MIKAQRIQDYMRTQGKVAESARIRYNQAETIFRNFQHTMEPSDRELSIHNTNENIKTTCPVNGEKALDPVYRKLSLVIKIARDPRSKYWAIAPSIASRVYEDIQVRMEQRMMKEAEYIHLLKTSKEKLLEEWVAQINERESKPA